MPFGNEKAPQATLFGRVGLKFRLLAVRYRYYNAELNTSCGKHIVTQSPCDLFRADIVP